MKVIKDKLRLVTSLTAEEINRIKSLFPAKRQNLYFHYSYYQRKPNFFAVWLLPKKPFVYRYFNAMLSFNPANPPLKISRYETTLYYGAAKSALSVCQYDKQKQLKEVKDIESVPMTRIEFRLKPKLKPITQYEKKDFIKLEGYRFVSNTKEMTGLRCLLKSITTGKREWRRLGRNVKQKITTAVKERTTDMLNLFLNYIEGDISGFMLDGLTASSMIDDSYLHEAG